MMGIPLWGKIVGSLVGVLAAGGFFIMQARGLIKVGVNLSDAKWEAKLALQQLEAQDAIDAAREAGKAEAASETAKAEARAASAMRALQEARNADPKFDEVLRTRWPRSYFDSVCGERPGCKPPNQND